jgi:hypothetical protein
MSENPPTMPSDARLATAIAEAAAARVAEAPEVCDAVGEIVAEQRHAGVPPERVLARLKAIAQHVRALDRLPAAYARAVGAWIVRCFLIAFYGGGSNG